MYREWFDGVIIGQEEIERMMEDVGPYAGDSVETGDTLVVRGEGGAISVYTLRFTDWPDSPDDVSFRKAL